MKLKSLVAGTLTCFYAIAAQSEGLYLGTSMGVMNADIGGFDDAINVGVLAGYDVFTRRIFAVSMEVEATTTVADGDVEISGTKGDWDIDTRAVYAVSRLGDRFYGKVRFGFLWEDFSVDIGGNSQSDSDSSISWGATIGWMFAEHFGLQADGTRIDSDIHYWNLGLAYRF